MNPKEISKVLEQVLEEFNIADIRENGGASRTAFRHREHARQTLENLYKEISQKEVEQLIKS